MTTSLILYIYISLGLFFASLIYVFIVGTKFAIDANRQGSVDNRKFKRTIIKVLIGSILNGISVGIAMNAADQSPYSYAWLLICMPTIPIIYVGSYVITIYALQRLKLRWR